MSTTDRTDADIQREVAELIGGAGLPLSVTVKKGVVTLEGVVLSEEEREAAADLTNFIPGVTEVVDALEVMDMEDDQPNVLFGMPTRPDEWDLDPRDVNADEVSLEEITTSDAGNVGEELTSDERVAVQEGVPYFPPTDPPVDISDDPDGIEVAAGFQSTSMDEDDEVEQDEDLQEHDGVQDSKIVDEVVRELNEDAATTQLNIHVASVRGTVYLTGFIFDPNDGDLAASVAERVDGVRQVVERLVVGERPVAVLRPVMPHSPNAPKNQVAVPSAAWRSTVARNERWLQAERGKVRAQIDERREEIASFGRDQADEGTVTNHQGDLGSDVMMAETMQTELSSMEDEIDAIHEALQMMEDGRYGICVTCGQLIDPARLRANPLAIRDIQHQQEFEDEEGSSMDDSQRRGIG
jgi:osmotically-inducible protein OsmY/RNA polymerase-binding transcription factor DksA